MPGQSPRRFVMHVLGRVFEFPLVMVRGGDFFFFLRGRRPNGDVQLSTEISGRRYYYNRVTRTLYKFKLFQHLFDFQGSVQLASQYMIVFKRVYIAKIFFFLNNRNRKLRTDFAALAVQRHSVTTDPPRKRKEKTASREKKVHFSLQKPRGRLKQSKRIILVFPDTCVVSLTGHDCANW